MTQSINMAYSAPAPYHPVAECYIELSNWSAACPTTPIRPAAGWDGLVPPFSVVD